MLDPTQRFSSRVEDYVRYRPRYPTAVVGILRHHCGLTREHVIADIGSGTGFLSELFLRNGNRVHGVEPNAEMRQAGERLMAPYPQFVSVNGRAEATTLPDACADLVAAGQAFHWFDRDAARAEFARILNAGGWVALVWNERTVASHFGHAYETMLGEHCRRSRRVDHREIDGAAMDAFFGAGRWEVHVTPNRQSFDFDGLRGRLLSSSYTPEPGTPGHEPLMAALRAVFDAHAEHGKVTCHYATKAYVGQLT